MTSVLTHPSESEPAIVHYGDETADIHSSSEEYAARFGGPVGTWMLEVQERAMLSMLDDECTSVLDVGGGHGQIAVPLSKAHRAVTVLGSSHSCSTRLRDFIESGSIAFRTGNLVELPFDAESFNLVVSFRLISHCTAWRTLIAEMCRTSNHAVVIDYPVWRSFNILTPLLFSLKRKLEGNTRTYRLFSSREIKREFRKHGFILAARKKQFFFPMGIHRAIKNPSLSRKLETGARWVGLTRFFGSPVIAKFVREGKDVRRS